MTRDEHLLAHLSEECVEIAHRVSKALRFGLDETQEGQPLTNGHRIVGELCDLRGVVEFLQERGMLPSSPELEASFVRMKKEKILHYMLYAEALGTVTPSFEEVVALLQERGLLPFRLDTVPRTLDAIRECMMEHAASK